MNVLVRHGDTICIQPGNACLYMYFSESFARRALVLFNFNRAVHVNKILIIMRTYCQRRQLMPDILKNGETIKESILDRRTEIITSNLFACIITFVDKRYEMDRYIG